MKNIWMILGTIVGILSVTALHVSAAGLSNPVTGEQTINPLSVSYTHLDVYKRQALSQLGLIIEEDHGFLDCRVDSRLKGAKITLSVPSFGATENILLAAVTAQGETLIVNAAREPEISDLADFLNGCGARIHGAGEGTIRIEGVAQLSGTTHSVIPDRIVAATYMAAAAVTGGSLTLRDIIPAHLGPVIPLFEETGCDVALKGHSLRITAPPRLHPMKTVRTMTYPGFPTDAQALMMTVAALTDGNKMCIRDSLYAPPYFRILRA